VYAIRRETDYALRAIAVMVSHRENGRALSTSSLTELCASSVDMMRKVMLKLAGAGIVKSSRGRNGGFVLARRPERISLALYHRRRTGAPPAEHLHCRTGRVQL